MQYPLISEYIEAILSAEDNFDKLSNLRPVLDSNGNPVMSSGNFAVVFKMKDIETDKMYAVKCFTREQDEREERYREIIKALGNINSPYFVTTRYYDNELFVDTRQGKETVFPVLVMDWVEGISLNKYMESIINNQFKRELLAKKFQELVCWLLPQNFAHGDIKPDNIIVNEDDSIVLLDYDGMFVPTLRGRKAVEMGTPLYKHHGRNTSFYNEYIDDYSSVLLLLLLKLNSIIPINLENYLTDNSAKLLTHLDEYMNHTTIAPLLSAFIMVSTFGRLDRQQVSCLLSDNSSFDYDKESALQESARKGDTLAMNELGSLYANGTYVPRNYSKALQWFMLAKLLGNEDATCGLCKNIFYNTDFEADNQIILNKLKKFRLNFAYCREGEKQYSSDNFDQAIYWIKKASFMGLSSSQRCLGICYEKGKGIEKNINLAVYWYQKAAESGNSAALQRVGWCYKNGVGLQKDCCKAVYYFKKAAEAGNSIAQCNLAMCYLYGEGVTEDYTKAAYWWQKAAESGNSTAQCYLAICYSEGVGVVKDYTKAVYWWQKAAESGNSTAQCYLAICFLKGEGVVMNHTKAIYWWQKAAEGGNSEAEYFLDYYCKRWKINDVVNVNKGEILHVGTCNTGIYSPNGKKFLCYFGTYGLDYKVKDGTEILCDDSFNDLYDETDGHYITNLYLPKTLKRIGNNVFCASISSISCESPNFKVKEGYLLSHDEKILFRYFGDEKVVNIPNCVKYIKGGAFSENKFEKLFIPDTVIHIGDNPFAGCDSIKEIKSNSDRFQVINDTLYDVKEKLLIGCWNYGASYMYIQSGTKSLGKNAFFGLEFQYITIPDSVEVIDETAFYHCLKLCNIDIPSHQYNRIYNLIPSYIKKYVLEDNGLPF